MGGNGWFEPTGAIALEPEGKPMMSLLKNAALALGFIALVHSAAALAAEPSTPSALKIDVPVQLKASKVVFNMDHLAFVGDQSIGLMYMKLIVQSYKTSQTPLELIGVFHGAAGYLLLNDAVYNKVRKSEKGNPYKDAIAALQNDGVQFEECGQTARNNGWVNADLLPGVKVNSGANLRLVQLMQDGYIQLQP